jgi:hypothetical protein
VCCGQQYQPQQRRQDTAGAAKRTIAEAAKRTIAKTARQTIAEAARQTTAAAHLEVVLLGISAHEHVEGGVHIRRLACCCCIHVQLVLGGVKGQDVRAHKACTVSHATGVNTYTHTDDTAA